MKNVLKILVSSILVSIFATPLSARDRWNEAQANNWYADQAFMAGCNYINRDSINQIEMWSAETFNSKQIDEEFGWAQELGFNAMRVFLHDLVWEENPQEFYKRVDQFLDIAQKHNIKILFVFFDSCWNPIAKLGKQPAPRRYVHNSGWVQSPTRIRLFDKTQWNILEKYVRDTVSRYKDDKRIIGWDLFNEPAQLQAGKFGDESDKIEPVIKLLEKVFLWARESNPSQPLTSGIYRRPPFNEDKTGDYAAKMQNFMCEQSDVISFHCYNEKLMDKCLENLKKYNRPIFCTEYMARSASHFNPDLGKLKNAKAAAFNWGFVNGKTNTIYPWNSWEKKYAKQILPPWFHDVLDSDGKPYIQEEADYIKSLMK